MSVKKAVFILVPLLAILAVAVPPWEDNVYVPPHGDMTEGITHQIFLGYAPLWTRPSSPNVHDVKIAWFALGGELVAIALLIGIPLIYRSDEYHYP